MPDSLCTGCRHAEEAHRHYHDRTYCGRAECGCLRYTSRYFWISRTIFLLAALVLLVIWVVFMVRALV
jgi:hypothetical protein